MPMIIPQTAFNMLKTHTLAPKLWAFLDNAEAEELFPVDVYELSGKWGVPDRQVLSLFLQAAETGVFELVWADTCNACGGDTLRGDSYSREQTCMHCGESFRPYADIHRKALFSVHPDVYQDTVPAGSMRAKTRPGVPAIDCLMTPSFRCGQGYGLIPPGTSLEIRNASVLFFTDLRLRGLYETLEDTEAYAEGYRILSAADSSVREEGGSVFRFAFDTAVALFRDSHSAVNAAVRIRGRSEAEGGGESGMISIHAGPVLAVNYGEKVGFSGRTLADIAAVHTKLKHRHISLSGQAYGDPKAAAAFEAYAGGSIRTRIVLKAAGRELVMYRGR